MLVKCPYCSGSGINHVDSRFICGFCVKGIYNDSLGDTPLETKARGATVYFKEGRDYTFLFSVIAFVGLVCMLMGLLMLIGGSR